MTTLQILQAAQQARGALLQTGTKQKDAALRAMAERLWAGRDMILAANALDMDAARGRISEVMLDRLALTEDRIAAMAEGVRQVAALPDPVGRTLRTVERPNVTSDAAALALKSGNVCVLRGGKEAFRSANAIVEALREGLVQAGLPREAVSLVQDTTRQSAGELMRAVGLVDLLIPRGGAGLIRSCVENALVPCIQTGTGICHVYVDRDADPDMALDIIENAKTSRPSVCNAEEVCLVHRDIAEDFLPRLKRRLVDGRLAAGLQPVELRLDRAAAAVIDGVPAGEADFDTEFLDYILAVGVVDSVEGAAGHISAHSTGHSDAIVTANAAAAERFIALVDSAAVYWNASTRFTDGGEFALGCEMGISTQKLHARGPMGLEELCSYKYVIEGTGQTR